MSDSFKMTVRQDRINPPTDRCSIALFDHIYPIENFSGFGIAVRSRERLSDEYFDACVIVDGIEIGRHHLKKVREEQPSENEFLTGFEITGVPLNADSVVAVMETRDVLQDFVHERKLFFNVPEKFALKAYRIKHWLEELEQDINCIQKSALEENKSYNRQFEETVIQMVSKFISESLSPVYDELAGYLETVPAEIAAQSFGFFRSLVSGIIYRAPFAYRAYRKPLGYAGDYEMMNIIYDRDTSGDSLFIKCLQRYFVDEPAAKALRNRRNFIQKSIIEHLLSAPENEICRIMSVASGPASEIQQLITDQPALLKQRRVEIHLIDQDCEALKYSQKVLTALIRNNQLPLAVYYHHLKIKAVICDSFSQKDFNLIYSAGLFDYLKDNASKSLAENLFSMLQNGGELIIGNFSKANPNNFGMGLVLDWHLIHRSSADMKNLFGHLSRKYRIESEEEGVNLFAIINK